MLDIPKLKLIFTGVASLASAVAPAILLLGATDLKGTTRYANSYQRILAVHGTSDKLLDIVTASNTLLLSAPLSLTPANRDRRDAAKDANARKSALMAEGRIDGRAQLYRHELVEIEGGGHELLIDERRKAVTEAATEEELQEMNPWRGDGECRGHDLMLRLLWHAHEITEKEKMYHRNIAPTRPRRRRSSVI